MHTMTIDEFCVYISALTDRVLILQSSLRRVAIPVCSATKKSGVGNAYIELQPQWISVRTKNIWHLTAKNTSEMIEIGTRFQVENHGHISSWYTYGNKSGRHMLINHGIIIPHTLFQQMSVRQNPTPRHEQLEFWNIKPPQLA